MNAAQRLVLGGLLLIALFELGISKRLGKLWQLAFAPAAPPPAQQQQGYQGDEHMHFDNIG